MANEEKEEIKKIVREELAKLTQPVEELPTSDNLADFTTLPVLSRDGSMKTLRAELLKGAKGDNGERGTRGEIGKTGEPGVKGEDGRIALVNHGTNDTTFALTPNTMHVWGEVERLNLSLTPNTEQNILAEYCFQFKVPDSKATEFQVQGARWANGVVPKLKQGKTYQGSVINNIVMVISD